MEEEHNIYVGDSKGTVEVADYLIESMRKAWEIVGDSYFMVLRMDRGKVHIDCIQKHNPLTQEGYYGPSVNPASYDPDDDGDGVR